MKPAWLRLLGLGVVFAGARVSGQDSLDAYMQNLAIAGNLQVESGIVELTGLDADTRFDLKVLADWNADCSIVKRGQRFFILVEPHMKRLDIAVRHRMRLPERRISLTQGYQNLLLHEYDHVAISTDERPRVLLRQLIETIGLIERPWNGPIPPAPNTSNILISEEIESRKTAVVKLVDDAYERLDEVSDHGRRPMERKFFFQSLYGLEQLKAIKFPYLEGAESILKSPPYFAAKRFFRY